MSHIFQNTCESCRNLKKFGCFTPPKSGDPESWYSKTLFFRHFFWEHRYFDPFRQNEPPPWYISLESCGSQLFRRKGKNILFSTVRPSEFWDRLVSLILDCVLITLYWFGVAVVILWILVHFSEVFFPNWSGDFFSLSSLVFFWFFKKYFLWILSHSAQ